MTGTLSDAEISQDLIDYYEERAAILQYQAGLHIASAEARSRELTRIYARQQHGIDTIPDTFFTTKEKQ